MDGNEQEHARVSSTFATGLTQSGNGVEGIAFAPIPEPSTWTFAFGGMTLLGAASLRRARRV